MNDDISLFLIQRRYFYFFSNISLLNSTFTISFFVLIMKCICSKINTLWNHIILIIHKYHQEYAWEWTNHTITIAIVNREQSQQAQLEMLVVASMENKYAKYMENSMENKYIVTIASILSPNHSAIFERRGTALMTTPTWTSSAWKATVKSKLLIWLNLTTSWSEKLATLLADNVFMTISLSFISRTPDSARDVIKCPEWGADQGCKKWSLHSAYTLTGQRYERVCEERSYFLPSHP